MDDEIAALLASPVPLHTAVTAPDAGGMADAAGLYAWWAPAGAVPEITGRSHPAVHGLELIYVGIAPNAKGGQRTMRDRLVRDHARRTRRSTLRRALASFLWEREGWTPMVGRDGRPTLEAASEEKLTLWMYRHLWVTWAPHPSPWELEATAINRLQPPLNVAMNSSHPRYELVRARRARWAQAASEMTD